MKYDQWERERSDFSSFVLCLHSLMDMDNTNWKKIPLLLLLLSEEKYLPISENIQLRPLLVFESVVSKGFCWKWQNH